MPWENFLISLISVFQEGFKVNAEVVGKMGGKASLLKHGTRIG